MKTASDIFNRKILKEGDCNLPVKECGPLFIDGAHEFADQFKSWIKLDGTNNPHDGLEVIVYDEVIKKQFIASIQKNDFDVKIWSSYECGLILLKVTHFHYKIQDPQ